MLREHSQDPIPDVELKPPEYPAYDLGFTFSLNDGRSTTIYAKKLNGEGVMFWTGDTETISFSTRAGIQRMYAALGEYLRRT